jgi:hypothetical protein
MTMLALKWCILEMRVVEVGANGLFKTRLGRNSHQDQSTPNGRGVSRQPSTFKSKFTYLRSSNALHN